MNENQKSIDLSQIFPEVYAELKQLAAARLAREANAHSWGATALVNEAFLRLADGGKQKPFENRRHFFAAAAETMRRILIDAARKKQSEKHGGASIRVELTEEDTARLIDPAEVLALHELLDQLAQKHPRQAETVKLRYFLGCTFVEIGEILGHSPDTAQDDWTFARAWFRQRWNA